MPRSGKRILHFFNKTGDLNSVTEFLDTIQKKVNYINLTAEVHNSCKDIKVILFGSRDLQHLATERIRALAKKYFELA